MLCKNFGSWSNTVQGHLLAKLVHSFSQFCALLVVCIYTEWSEEQYLQSSWTFQDAQCRWGCWDQDLRSVLFLPNYLGSYLLVWWQFARDIWPNGGCAYYCVHFIKFPYSSLVCGVSDWCWLSWFAFVWPCRSFLRGWRRFCFFVEPLGNPYLCGSFLCFKQLLWYLDWLAPFGLLCCIRLLLAKWRVMPRFL